MRDSREACTASVLGAFILHFLVRDVKGRRWRDSKKGFVVPSECNSSQNENANFLVLHWCKRVLSFILFFFLFGHSSL